MSQRDKGEWEESLRERTDRGDGWTPLEIAATLWAVCLVGYFYYAKGYITLMGQIWSLIVG